MELHYGDVITVFAYFFVCMSVGIWASCRANTSSVKGYFLAGRNMNWFPVGLSIFATNVGSQFFVGMAGSAAANGLDVVIYEWHAVYILVLLGWVFIPVYVASKAYTMPAYLKRRYGGQRLRVYLSCLAIFLIIVQQISGGVYSGAVFIQQSVGWNMYLSIVSIICVTAVYTIVGGLTAVIWTDSIQTFILLFGTIFLAVKGLIRVDGVNGLFEKYMNAVPNVTQCPNNVTAGFPRSDSLHIFRDPVDGDIPWPGAIFGLTPMAIVAWCTDQISVQRVLAAKSHTHAKGGILLAAVLKILPLIIIVFPGMASRVLFPDEVGCVNPDICKAVCDNENGCSNIAYPKLVIELMPPGLRGLMIAVMLSALMSTLTSIFNSASSIFTLDLYLRVRRQASERELMIVGRLFIVALVVVSIAWIPILTSAEGGQLWNYLQAIQAYMAPPWCMVFLLGIFWKRTTEPGAFWGLMAGLVTGLCRMIMEFVYSKPTCGEPETRPKILYKVHFFYFAVVVSVVTTLVTVIVSFITQPRPESKLRRVTWFTKYSDEPQDESDNENDFDAKPSDEILEEKQVTSPLSIGQRLYNMVCCYPNITSPVKLPVTDEDPVVEFRGHGESRKTRRFLDAAAIIIMVATTFLIGFFA